MQYNNKDYKPKLHDRWRALTVKNPYATQLVTAAYEDNGIVYGEKCIEVRSKNTPYRGDLMVCSSANPVIAGYESGVTLGLVELYDVSPSPSLPRKIGRIPAYRPKNANPLQRGSVG